MSVNVVNIDDPDEGHPVRFISWNVKGLNGPVKRAKVFSHLKQLKPDILFLQETHLRLEDHNRLRRNWISQIFHSKFTSRSRGVAILVAKSTQFSPSNVISDPNGRFLIVSGSLFQKPVVLVNVYAPNWDDVHFANKILSLIPNLNTHQLIFSGDLNCAIDPLLDRSNPKQISSGMAKSFSLFMQQSGFVDPWRILNPLSKQFSFFSHVHRSFSRLDYFFIDNSFISLIKRIEYTAIVISDHSPVLLDLSFPLNIRERPPWRFDPLLLSSEEFCSFISTNINTFLTINETDSVSYSVLWETLKAYLRGLIISYSSYASRERKKEMQALAQSILELDRKYSETPSAKLYKERADLQTKFNYLTTKQSEQLILKTRGLYYEYGDKSSRLMAHQLKRQAASRLIPLIKDTHQNTTNKPKEINNIFKDFYYSLYTSEFPSDTTDMEHFLDSLEIPTLNSEATKNVDQALTQDELNSAIMAMQSNKSPGPDGYPTNFYKKFKEELTPILMKMFQESLKNGSLPPTLSQASISLLLKKDKDPTQCGSYRPISLLNVDVKILAKVLACRLERLLPKIISDDQTGFIKNRHSFSNIRRLAAIVYSPSASPCPEVVLSLDAEKAFDRVEWSYLFNVLKRFGFGNIFVQWVKLLYHSPLASIQTNYSRSDYFPLTRGTRQGCPLSPLLFAIAIEPLSIALKSTSLFQGIKRGDMEHRVSLYADDLLLYINDPMASGPRIVSLLNQFGAFSGYKLNFQKSICFPVNNSALHIQPGSFPFPISQDGFKYLGIHFTRSFSSLSEANYGPQVNQMKADFERWRSLPLTMAGKIQSVKMTILPRFLYLFQCLPVFIPKSFFKSVNQSITSFIWGNKIPRVKKTILQRDREVGGLGLPSFIHYYWASNIQKILFWLHRSDTNWCLLEAQFCRSTSLQALVYSSLPVQLSRFISNPVVLSTLKIFNQFRCHYKLTSASVLGPIYKNHLFPPSTLDSTFKQWSLNGLIYIKDLYTDNIFDSFENVCKRYNLPRSSFFKYLQIRHFVKSKFVHFPDLPVVTVLDKLTLTFVNKGLISLLYSQLMSLGDQSLNKFKSRWEDELGIDLPEEYWAKALKRVNSSSSCARLGLIQFKVLHRVHLSKARLASIYPGTDASCDKCSFSPANLVHSFWSCPQLSGYWAIVFKTLSEALGVMLEPCPLIAIFGVADETLGLNANQSDIIAFTSLLARRRILLVWKSSTSPSASVWLEDVMFFLKLEKIKFTLRGSVERFYFMWGPFLSYFESLKELPTG